MTPASPDMLAMVDPSSLIQLPWKPEVAWVVGDLVMAGQPVEQSPRRVLQRQLERAAERGYRVRTGVECEFFVLSRDGSLIGDELDTQGKPCYDQLALMRRYELITQVCDAMQTLGWGPYQNDHEDANGQFELNWTYADALVTADRHTFFKFMVKSLAEAQGLRASFMPSPLRTCRATAATCTSRSGIVRASRTCFATPPASSGCRGSPTSSSRACCITPRACAPSPTRPSTRSSG